MWCSRICQTLSILFYLADMKFSPDFFFSPLIDDRVSFVCHMDTLRHTWRGMTLKYQTYFNWKQYDDPIVIRRKNTHTLTYSKFHLLNDEMSLIVFVFLASIVKKVLLSLYNFSFLFFIVISHMVQIITIKLHGHNWSNIRKGMTRILKSKCPQIKGVKKKWFCPACRFCFILCCGLMLIFLLV